jgi:membrane protein required for colicin V production
MTLDLLIAALAVLVGFAGARRGASAQLAGWTALVVAVLFARPGAQLLGPAFTTWLHTSPGTGSVAAGFATFVVVLVLARIVLSAVLRGLFSLGNPERRGPDRFLGFLLGAAKVLAVAWVALSALAFVEERVARSGKAFGILPERSIAFAVARRWNLFALADFAPAQSLVKLEQALKTPEAMAKLSSEPAVAALLKDARWKALSQDAAVRRALEQHDVATLLRSQTVANFLKDADARDKLQAALEAIQKAGATPTPGVHPATK